MCETYVGKRRGHSRVAVASALPNAYFYADGVLLSLHEMLETRGCRLRDNQGRLAGDFGAGGNRC
jgi:hypothetical protein